MILIRTQKDDLYEKLLVEHEDELGTLLVLDSYDIKIKDWIKNI